MQGDDTAALAAGLRRMRNASGVSQLELALRLGISQRHVSYVESRKSRPSRDLIVRWAQVTGASDDELNAALHNAGFSPNVLTFPGAPALPSSAFAALSDMLIAHDPYPALVFDADWKIRAMNESGRWLSTFGMPAFLAETGVAAAEVDMIAAVAHPQGFLSTLRNAREVGYALLTQLRAEQMTRPSLKPRVDRLEASLQRRFGPPPSPGPVRPAGDPHLRLVVDTHLGPLTFLLVQSVFALPQNVTQASLRTELWFPTDDLTRRVVTARLPLQPPVPEPPAVARSA